MATKKTTAKSAEAVKIEDAVAAGKKTVEQAVTATKENVEKASTATLKGYDEAAEINKSNMDAMTVAANIWSKGVEELGKAYFAFTQNNIDAAVSASKAMMAVKTVNEAVELQSDLTRNSVDQLVAESSKLSELTYKVTNDALAPIQSHMNESFEKLAKSAA